MKQSLMVGLALNVSVDTNLLVRIAVDDDPIQARAARRVFREAEIVVCTLPMLCEVVWVLSHSYNYSKNEIHSFLSQVLVTKNVRADRPVIKIGLACLLAGGDFADGVIAELGREQGADIFLTFDRKARKVIGEVGIPVARPDQMEM